MIVSGMLILFLALVAQTTGYNILCYYLNWNQYRPGKGQFLPEHVDPMLCTHLSYGFCNIVNMNLATYESNDIEMYGRINALKTINPKLKTLLAVGAGKMPHSLFVEVSKNDKNRNTFAKNVINYVRQHKFDGFEVSWEFPGATERAQFTLFIKKLRTSFEEEAKATGGPRLQLWVSASPLRHIIEAGFDVANVAPHVDFVNVRTYNYYGVWCRYTGFNSALYDPSNDVLNVNWSAKYIESQGAPKEKINIGIATYGRSFTLNDQNVHGLKAPFNAAGNALPYSKLPGFAFYYEICKFIKSGARVTRPDVQGTPYLVEGNQWICYDDAESVTLKAQYVKNNKFAGVAVWTLDNDDFTGTFCKQGKYPLHKAISNTFASSEPIRTPGIVSPTDEIVDDSPILYNILCYYINWSQYTPGKGKFLPEHVDPKLCTHITFAFCKIVGMKLNTYESNDVEMYQRINALKTINPKLKTFLAVGGSKMGLAPFVEVSKNDINRVTFAKNVISYVRQHNFDGFEVDWEYPGAEEKDQYTLFIEKLRESFETDAEISGRPLLQLAIAVSGDKGILDAGLEVSDVAEHVDFLNIRTYNFYGSQSKTTGFNSALYAHPKEKGSKKYLNVNFLVKYLEAHGVSQDKINIGIAAYGRSFTLKDMNANYILSQITGPGNALSYSETPGIAFYYEICEIINSGGQVTRVESQGNPYVYKGNQWIGYEDAKSIALKAQYVKDHKYAGVAVWTMDEDDFNGTFCNQGKYPLLKAIRKMFITREGTALASTADENEKNASVGAHNAISATWIFTLLVALLA